MKKINTTGGAGPRLSFATHVHNGPISPLVGLVLGALLSAMGIGIATTWSAPWMIFGVLVGALIGGVLGYWTSHQQH